MSAGRASKKQGQGVGSMLLGIPDMEDPMGSGGGRGMLFFFFWFTTTYMVRLKNGGRILLDFLARRVGL